MYFPSIWNTALFSSSLGRERKIDMKREIVLHMNYIAVLHVALKLF